MLRLPPSPHPILVGLALAAGLLAGGPRMAVAVEFLDLDAIHAGQRAIGHTVFTGRVVEEFELEIVGVVPGGRADGAMILARALGPRLEHTGIAAGMSGSPIYIDGKLIGALAFGWPFSRDALCGIQPIGEMIAVLRLPDGRPGGGFGDGPAVALDPPVGGGLERLRVPLVAGGFGAAALAELEPWAAARGFQLVRGGGGGRAGGDAAALPRLGPEAARAALVPGAAVAVDLMRGDMNLSAIGTLTYRDGDRLVAFGHPFFQAGDVAYPLALAEVTTIVASASNSFKLGTPAEQVGTITQDRRAAVGGTIGPPPRMLPLTVRVRTGDDFTGAARAAAETYHFALLRHRTLAPRLAGIAAVGALSAAAGAVPEATWRWRLSLAMPGRAPLEWSDTASGALQGAAGSLAAPLALLLDNPFAPLDADSVVLDVEVVTGAARAQVWAARVEPAVVRPGDMVDVIATLQDLRGARSEIRIPLRVPDDQPEGRLVLAVGGGVELDRQESPRLPGRHRAVSLSTLLDRLADRRRDDHLYVALYGRGVEPTVDGVPYPDLPLFAQRMMSAERSSRPAEPWGRLAPILEQGFAVATPVAGLLTVPLGVRRNPRASAAAAPADRANLPMLRTVKSDEEDP